MITSSDQTWVDRGRRNAEQRKSATLPGIGHDDAMAFVVNPVHPLPTSIQEALEAVKAPARVAIAHYLASHPRSRMGEIVGQVGGERHMIKGHLTAMERVGLVVVSVPGSEDSASRWREYDLNHGRWTELMIRLINYLPSDPKL